MMAMLLLNITAGSLWVADSSPRWVAAVVLNVSVSGVRSPLIFFVGRNVASLSSEAEFIG